MVEERGVGGGMTVGSAGESVQKEGGGGAGSILFRDVYVEK